MADDAAPSISPEQTQHPAAIEQGTPSTGTPATAEIAAADPFTRLTAQNANDIWTQARDQLSGIVLANAREYQSVEVTASGQLRILFTEKYKICKSVCERPEHARQISEAIAAAAGQPIRVEFELLPGERQSVPRATQRKESRLAVAESPLVQRAQELFGARPITIERKK